MVLWTKLWYYGTKLWYYEKTMVLYRELWNVDLRRKKHGRLPNAKKVLFIMEKKNYGKIPEQLKFMNNFMILEL